MLFRLKEKHQANQTGRGWSGGGWGVVCLGWKGGKQRYRII